MNPLAQSLFQIGLKAIASDQLVKRHVSQTAGFALEICGRRHDIKNFDKIVILGAGKAGAGMVRGLEAALADCPLEIFGQVNVPSDCIGPTNSVALVGARPAGINEPTEQGVAAAAEILRLAESCGPRDLCLCLISGGGSALLPAPVDGLSLESKRSAIADLAAAGADIHVLNLVRRKLSRIKGGGLLRHCNAAVMETLVISDVIGDDLATIASGPTVLCHDAEGAAYEAYADFLPDESLWPPGLKQALMRPSNAEGEKRVGPPAVHHTTIIGSNAVATQAVEAKARRLGCDVINLGGGHAGEAADVGREWARRLQQLRDERQQATQPLVIVDGGEPVVTLAETAEARKGGRNQEVVLAAIDELGDDDWHRISFLSGGTDGEDGPTDAAGAIADAELVARMKRHGLDPAPFLRINNSYPFFDQVDGLIRTGPTHTNVMDVRIGVVFPVT